jgi:hypothetical protein
MPLDSSTTPPPPKPKSTATALKADGCASLYSASLACLDRAGYDKEACQGAFDAYKACRATEVRGRFLETTLLSSFPLPIIIVSHLSPLLLSSYPLSTRPSGRPA